MQRKYGVPVSMGVAIGEAFVFDSENYRISYNKISADQKEEEKQRYLNAVAKASQELIEIEKATQKMRDISIIFQGHRFIIEDPTTQQEILDSIESKLSSAQYAVSQVMWKHRKKLKSLPSEYFTQRISDLDEVENRLLRHLLNKEPEDIQSLQSPVVIVARHLSTAQTATLPQEKVLGIITETGGRTSHTAIVARTRGMPAVVAMGDICSHVRSGDVVIVDGSQGQVIIKPDMETLEKYKRIQKDNLLRLRRLKRKRDLPAETLDGHKIKLRSNIESPSEIKIVLANGSEGIGLYRTEFIYIDNPCPSEEDHFQRYKRALKSLENRKLVIRTMDFGADKNFVHDQDVEEPNPFLGCRSIRLSLEQKELFKTQLRAILRASVYGDVDLMFPMISSLEEIVQAKKVLNEAKQELREKKLSYNENINVGIMIEIPSAALIADLLAKEVDFFSIGTNDLIQYTLAVDRSNERVAHLYKPAHPAVFRLIQQVIKIGRKEGVKVSVCGEMAGEALYIPPLLGMGVREFSLSPGLIPEIKEMLRSITVRDAKKIARALMSCQTHEQCIEYLLSKISLHGE